MKNYLAFDLGGSSGKLSLLTLEGGQLHMEKVYAFPNRPISFSGHLYWDILGIYEQLCTGIRKAVALTGDRIDGIAFDSFCNDFALLSKDGRLMTPVYCYRDKRTARCQEETYRVMAPEDLYAINGNQIAPFNTLLQLDAMRQEGQGGILDQAHRLLFVSDLFVWLLTGKAVTEYTTASVTQMYDYAADDWSDRILGEYGIRKDLFAPVVKPGTIVGRTSPDFNAAVGTQGFSVTAVCHHDTASAFLASIGVGDHAIISTGTWCLVGVETDRPVITAQGFAANVANEGGYPGHHRVLRNVMGTWIVQEILREEIEAGRTCSFELLDAGAKEYLGNMQGDELPWFDVDDPVFFTPGHMAEKVNRGCLAACGQKPAGMGERIAAVYLSLARKYQYSIGLLERMTGRSLSGINMIGGGSKSSLMCRITASVCGLPVTAGPADATAMGNVLVQMLADGSIGSVEEGRELIRASMPYRVYQPDRIIEHAALQLA